MSKPNDGGPAYPVDRWTTGPWRILSRAGNNLTDAEPVNYPGMSLRDWFAGQAIAQFVLLAPEEFHRELADSGKSADELAAKYAYRIADALLAARDGEQS